MTQSIEVMMVAAVMKAPGIWQAVTAWLGEERWVHTRGRSAGDVGEDDVDDRDSDDVTS